MAKTQSDDVLLYLSGDGKERGITGLEALHKFGVGHLPSVMFKIGRNLPAGLEVQSEFEKSDGGAHGPKSFKRYWIRPRKVDDRQGALPGFELPSGG